MLIGYARVSRTDGSQSLDLQLNALIETGVEKSQIESYQRPDQLTVTHSRLEVDDMRCGSFCEPQKWVN